ncbi:restriction endonuclease [Accumulibacter sp.]|uniref:restriction endonuclease n=1 Tax=Accumulibacter sp. TaxID=2053492 RepID=UPI0028C49B30|nr:restriction endonuclease [Accumulibacter sp.]
MSQSVTTKKHAEFVQWIPHILDALREFGGSATPREVCDAVARLAHVPDEKRFARLESGSLRFPNQVAWGRQYLVWEGLLSSPKHGIWMLTPSSRERHLTLEQAREIVRKWVAIHAEKRAQSPQAQQSSLEVATAQPSLTSPSNGYGEELLLQLQALSPESFEQFCADLLKHLGLERVRVTGGKGDKGIDGEGYLPLGPIVTAKIAFQCKRYSGSVSPSEVQAFQGAIGDAEKGIFFTTGYFTDSARDAARRPGCKPIELIDGDRLIELLEAHEFGLLPAKTYAIDYTLLSNYGQDPKKAISELPSRVLPGTRRKRAAPR